MKFIFSVLVCFSISVLANEVPIVILGKNKSDTDFVKTLLMEKAAIPPQLIAIETMIVSDDCTSSSEERTGVILELCVDENEELKLRYWNKEKWEKTMKVFSHTNN